MALHNLHKIKNILLRHCGLPLIYLFSTLTINAQINVKDSSVVAPMVWSSYCLQFPGADMAKRFGINSSVGFQFQIKTKSNWLMGISGDFLFGNQVHEKGMLDSIKTSDGFLISSEGKLVDTRLQERGFSIFITSGKMFPAWGPNKNSGIAVFLGAGFLEHKIRIELIDGKSNNTPQMSDQMKKGYDRLSYGIAFNQSVGYLFLSNNRITNFYAGLEIMEAFTKNRRTIDYDLMKKDDRLRMDLLFGLRFAWILPIYKRVPSEFYMY